VEATLQVLAPVLASGGRVTAAGYVSSRPAVDASPPRSTATYANAVEELRARYPHSVATAEAAVPAPELFGGTGNYPAATASGIDPAALSGLPWRARLAAAWEPDRAKAFAITQTFGGPDGEYLAAMELSRNSAVKNYISTVEGWYGTAGVGDQPGDFEPMTDDEEAVLFGRMARPAQ
jgi:hypothetical protein